ncbi:VPLPA-CTERM sorting domain-containing protein [uncultured Roseobacter sp.]|uniref:VPLPA-CTERM sorting domain-containing protein n=1 Tax=uncultured Roseobacter sp. TaxID=114847 RepID=UPI002639CC68|nr:VPLPA-CTERM sorting domain-containing protein [uncultured Roseobacter sp.]
MTSRIFLPAAVACSLLSAPLFASTVTLTVNGSTDGSDGSVIYTPGSAYIAELVFDADFADGNPDPGVGRFFDFGTITTALTSFSLTTEFGNILYEPSAVQGLPSPTSLPTVDVAQVNQIQGSNQQGLTVTSHLLPALTDGWSGALGALLPASFTFGISATGSGDYIFNDPNTLLSGAVGGLDNDFDLLGGVITVSDARGFVDTELFFGAGEFSITGDSGDVTDPLAPIPLPASLPLMLAGMLGLGWVARRQRGE